jgi:CBS domain-containing protein
MEIEGLITRAVLTLKGGDTVKVAATRMMERGVGSAVIVDSGKPMGIITDRDALRLIAQGVDGSQVKVRDCVPKRLMTVSPATPVIDAARIMREKNFRHLVVVDPEGGLVGVFSMRDLVVGLLQERASATPVSVSDTD